jgi:hypothetical protein
MFPIADILAIPYSRPRAENVVEDTAPEAAGLIEKAFSNLLANIKKDCH